MTVNQSKQNIHLHEAINVAVLYIQQAIESVDQVHVQLITAGDGTTGTEIAKVQKARELLATALSAIEDINIDHNVSITVSDLARFIRTQLQTEDTYVPRRTVLETKSDNPPARNNIRELISEIRSNEKTIKGVIQS